MKNVKKERKIFLIFFGPPGSGKDTQAENLAAGLKLPFFNPGELFRREIKAGTALGKKIAPVMARGGLIKDGIVAEMAVKFLEKEGGRAGAIFDGYPRTIAQTRFLQERLERVADRVRGIYAILIDVGDKEVSRRLANRRVCKCGETFHLIHKPPRRAGICDRCGRRLFRRGDDRPGVIGDRLALYHRHIGPMLDFFERKHELIKVDGEKDIAGVGREIKRHLRERGVI